MKNFMKKLKWIFIFTIIFSFFSVNNTSAQIFTGGDLSATFINGVKVDIAPIIGYKYKNFSVGLSPVILYTASSPDGTGGEFSYGGRVFAEYDVYKGLFFHAEFKAMNTGYLNDLNDIVRGCVMGAPVGAGYEYEITKGVWFKGMVLYDALLHINLNQNLPNANPTVRGGITYVF
jgi:hypothetical protein